MITGSCWLFWMPDALRDGVNWGGGGRLWEQGHVEGRGGGFVIDSSG